MNSNQIFSDDKISSTHSEWCQNVPNKSKITDGRHFEKNEKMPYFLICLTNFDEIWPNNVSGPSAPDSALKIYNFENTRWRTATILKK